MFKQKIIYPIMLLDFCVCRYIFINRFTIGKTLERVMPDHDGKKIDLLYYLNLLTNWINCCINIYYA